MKRDYLSISAYICLSIFLFVGCQQKEKNSKERIIEYPSKKKTTKKDGVHKKGIEYIADYQEQIRKGIYEQKSSYKKGYLIEEFNKAKNSAFSKKAVSLISPVFTERGPNNVPGRSRGIAIDPNNSDRWFVGTVGGGVWLTEDGGTSWSGLTDFKIPNLATSTIVISQTDSDILYAGTGEPFGNLGAIGGSGVFKTTDGGITWQHLTTTAAFGNVGRIIIDPADDDHVLIGTSLGIFSTTDGGLNWVLAYNSTGIVQDLDADPSDFNIQYGSVKGLGIVKSIDAGLNWTLVFDKANFNTNHSRFETSVSSADPNTVFLSVYSGSGGTVSTNTDFYVSRDKGVTFTNLTTTDTNANLITGQGWYDNVIMAHPYDANIFYVGGVAVFKVTVTGNTFTSTSIASGYDNSQINTDVHVDQHGIFSILGTSNNEFKILLANDGGVYSSTLKQDPGVTEGDFSSAVMGKNSTQFYGAAKQNGFDNYLAGAQDNGCWVSLSNDATANKSYQYVFGGDGFEVIWHYNNPLDFIVTSQNNTIGRYVNGAYDGYNSLSGDPIFYTKIANADNNPNTVFSISGNGVWRSTDFAENWNLIPITSNYTPAAVSALNVKVSTADPNIVWAGSAMTEDGSFVLQVSQDNGQTFVNAGAYDNPNNTHNLYISGLATSYTEKNRAYALFSSQGKPKILKTEDLGVTWSDITGFETSTNTGFPDVAVHSVLEMPFNKDLIWAGTDIGLFQTENGGASWSMIADLPSVAVYDMKVVNDQVVIATYGRGVWSATIAELNTYTLPIYAQTWTGIVSSDWFDAGNWFSGFVPNATDNVHIPAGVPNYPTAANAITVNSITIASGASFIAQSTVTGTVTYNRNLETDNWYLLSSPVTGETIDNLITNHTFATGTAPNIGLAPYDNTQVAASNRWNYQTLTSTGTVDSGKGYSVKLASAGNVAFTGTITDTNATPTIVDGNTVNTGGSSLNLIGNPYTSFVNSGLFLPENTDILESQTIWVWDQSSGSSGDYITKVTADAFKVAPTQGFFVERKAAGADANFIFNVNNQSHETTDTFLKSENRPEIQLYVSDGTDNKFAKIYYINGTTTGFDNGYDGELFGGVVNNFSIYSHLVSDNVGKKYQIQSLPDSNFNEMVIPIGVKATTGDLTFTLDANNFPSDYKVYLEDKKTDTFVRLDEVGSEYKFTLSAALKGENEIGRFFLHTTESVLEVNNFAVSNVLIYTSNKILNLSGLPEGEKQVIVYDVMGKIVLQENIKENKASISVKNLTENMYVALVKTEKGNINKKIIIK